MREPVLRRVVVSICSACIAGEGQECHTPGCVLWLHRVDLPIHEELLVDFDEPADADVSLVRSWVDSEPICRIPKGVLNAISRLIPAPNRRDTYCAQCYFNGYGMLALVDDTCPNPNCVLLRHSRLPGSVPMEEPGR